MAAICSTMLHAHAADALGIRREVLGHAPLVDLARQPLHDVELAPEDRPCRLVPDHGRSAHRSRLQRSQDVELPPQVVGLEQPRGFGPHPDDHLTSFALGDDGDEERLGRMADGDPVESLHGDLRTARELPRDPRRQTVLGGARHGDV